MAAQPDPSGGPDPDAIDFAAAAPPEEVSAEQVRGVLRAIGMGAHRIAGDPRFPEHWSFTSEELDDLTPPFTTIVNSSAFLRRAVARSDHAQVAIALLGWTMRNLELAQAIAEEEQALQTEPEPPTVPDADVAPLGPLWEGTT